MASIVRDRGASSTTHEDTIALDERPGLRILTVQPSDAANSEEQDTNPLLRRACNPAKEKRRNVVGFWLMGFFTNVTYVVNNAGAGDIVPGNYALIYVCGVLPSFLIKLTAPYWFHRVPYRVRILIAGVCAALNFVLVMYGPTPGVQLLGVALAAVQGGIGEATGLALSQFYREPKRCLVM